MIQWMQGSSGLVVGALAGLVVLAALLRIRAVPRPMLVMINEGLFRARAVQRHGLGIRVSALPLCVDESLSILGIDLGRHAIQPLWLEIENKTERSFYFLPAGMDPEYFAPWEVSFLYRRKFDRDWNSALDDKIEALAFDSRSLILPGETHSGLVFVNRSYPSMVVDVDLVGRKWSSRISLFVAMPGTAAVQQRLATASQVHEHADAVDIDDEAILRAALEELPCCDSRETGARRLPLNVVLIGEVGEWGPAFVRRNYRYVPARPWHAFDRVQDLSGRKISRWTAPQPYTLRVWLTALRYRGKPVWAAQASGDLGGRFAQVPGGSHHIEPDLDVARDDIFQDLMYSQSIETIAFVKTARHLEAEDIWRCHTDGLSVVLFFRDSTVSLAEIDFLDWERPSDDRRRAMDSPSDLGRG